MKSTARPFRLPFLLVLAASQAGAGDTAWQIHLQRKPGPGERCSVSATGTQDRKLTTTDSSQSTEKNNEHLEVTYAAIHQVLAVDPAGHPSGILVRIERFLTNDGSGPIEQFPAGTEITATTVGDHTQYRLGRETLEGTLSDALDLAGAKLPSPHEPSEDAVFHNHSARHPGEQWNADPRRLADAIAATSAFLIDPASSSASLSFDKMEPGTIPALSTTTIFKIIPVGFQGRTPSSRLFDSNITSTTVRLFPIDPSLPMIRESVETTMKLIQKSNPGPRATTTETTLTRQVTRHYLPLPQN
jgi:hypothetical protein